jgi:hypothetical protein
LQGELRDSCVAWESPSKPEDESSAKSKVVLHVGRGIWQLRPQPVGLEGTQGKMVLQGHVDTAADIQRQAIRAVLGSGSVGKDTVQAIGLSG